MWCDACLEISVAGGADLNNHTPQNIARQYAVEFGKNDPKDPLNHHLIQNTEYTSVTTIVDLVPPRGDGVDHSGDNVKLKFQPRGFFADQFEVSLFFSPTIRFLSLPPLCNARIPWVSCGPALRLTTRNVPMTLLRRVFPATKKDGTSRISIDSLSDQPTSCSRFPPVGYSYVQGCVAS